MITRATAPWLKARGQRRTPLTTSVGLAGPDAISDQWMLLTEGATITALVEGDRAAAHKARAGADAILRSLHVAALRSPLLTMWRRDARTVQQILTDSSDAPDLIR